jgi:uncharacterized membrane protein YqjE
MANPPPAAPGLHEGLRQFTENVSALMALHLKLLRLELAEEMRHLGKPLLALLMCLPWVLMGAVFLSVALALVLTRWLPLWASVGVLGLCQLGGPLIAVFLLFRKGKEKWLVPGASSESPHV